MAVTARYGLPSPPPADPPDVPTDLQELAAAIEAALAGLQDGSQPTFASPADDDIPVWDTATGRWRSATAKQARAAAIAAGGITDGYVAQTSFGLAKWLPAPTQPSWSTTPPVIVGGAGYVANTLTPLLSASIPGGSLAQGRTMRARIWGDLINQTAGDQTLRLQVVFGGTTLVDWNNANIGIQKGAVRNAWWFDLELGEQPAGGAIVALAQARFPSATSVNPTTGVGGNGMTRDAIVESAGGLAIDDTVAQTLAINAAWGAASASLDLRAQHVRVEVL